jgi:asparagine synthase (glutamine-hydrolysing)
VCGICGFAGFEDAALLARMTASLAHRGPDSDGFFRSREASLGFRRLSIIDLSTGEQPLANEDGSLHVILNGEIYNYRELREGLERRGHRFCSRSDVEVVVHLYEEDGPALVHHLEGMFAFALWDDRKKRLLVARDRLGIKPLYFAQRGGRLLFASEAKALLQDPTLPRRLDAVAVERLLRYLYLPGPQALLAGVERLPPGSWLTWQNGGVEIGRYWEPHLATTRRLGEADAVAEFRARFEEAVRSHLVSDVSLGALLSGGLDSAGVVAQMARLDGRPFKTFTIGFAGADDERPLARRLAERFGTDHREFELSPERFVDDLPRLVWHLEEPTPISFLPLFYLAEFARREVKVVLIGEGADELFAGYKRLLPYAPALRFLPSGLQRRLYEFGVHSLAPSDGRDSFAPPPATGARSKLGAILEFEQRHELPDYQLHRVDRMTMAWGLEARVPYLDHRLVEFANSLPDSLKLRGFERKYILRRALADLLPAEVLEGSKRGLGKPFRSWFGGGFREAARRYLNEESLAARNYFGSERVRALVREERSAVAQLDARRGSQLFLLLSLELYCRLFLDPPPDRFPVAPPERTQPVAV